MMYRQCPICGNDRGRTLREISMCLPSEIHLPTSYNIVCCSKCGFTYADVNASQVDYDVYYSSCNMYAENNELKMEMLARKAEYKYAYELIRSKVDLNAKILDVGCGSGDFLCYLKEIGFKNLCGMDPSEESIKKLERKGIKGICGGCFEPVKREEMGSYDIVVSTAVIEHIYDLKKYIFQITKYMRKDQKSYLLLVAPAVEGFGEYICAVPNYFNHEHINYFSKISLDNLLSNFSMFRINEDVYVEEGTKEKALVVLFESKEEKVILKHDDLSEKSIEKYFNGIQNTEKELENRVKRLYRSQKKIVIWGSGSYAMHIMKRFPLLLEKIECFVDNNTIKQGSRIAGKEIFSPEYLEMAEDSIVAICSMKNAIDIQKQLRRIAPGCSTIIL